MKWMNAGNGLTPSSTPCLVVVTTAVWALSLIAHVSCFSQPANVSRRSTGAAHAADGGENNTSTEADGKKYAHLRPGSLIRHYRYSTTANYCIRNSTLDAAPRPRFLLGALLPLTARSGGAKHDSRKCTEPRSVFIVQFVEALKLAVDEALAASAVARQLISGVEIRDTCGTQEAAGEQALALSTRSFSAYERCRGRRADDDTGAGYEVERDEILAGVIGPGLSRELETASPILNSRQVPHISYWSTSDGFTEKAQYPYLVRTTSADSNQAYAIHEILRYFGWSYVHMLHVEIPSGSTTLADRVRLLAARPPYAVCFAQDAAFDLAGAVSGGRTVRDLVWQWYAARRGTDGGDGDGDGSSRRAPCVVLLLAGAPLVEVVFAALQENALEHPAFAAWLAAEHFVWIANDSWISEAAGVVHHTQRSVPMGFHTVIGTTLKIPHTPLTVDADAFQDRLLQRLNSSYQRPETFESNPWLALAWQKRFDCRLPFVRCEPAEECHSRRVCDVNMSVAEAFSVRREHFSAPVSSGSLWLAAKTFVWMLEAGYRTAAKSGSPSSMANNIATALKTGSVCGDPGYEMKGCSLFDVTRDLHPSFRIQAVMRNGNGEWTLQDLFQWANGSGRAFFAPDGVDLYKLRFRKSLWADGKERVPTSICSARCANGSIKEPLKERVKGDIRRPGRCCWRCVQCASNEYHNAEQNACRQCDAGQLAVDGNTRCENAPDYYVSHTTKTGVALIAVSAAAIVVVLITAVVYHRHRRHAVVKAAYLESSMVLLASAGTCLATNPLYFLAPFEDRCVARKVLISVNVCMSVSTLISRALRHVYLSNGDNVHRFVRKLASLLVPTARQQVVVLALSNAAMLPFLTLFGTYLTEASSEVLVSRRRRDVFCLNDGAANSYAIVAMVCVLLALCYVAFSARKVVVVELLAMSRLPNEAQLMAFVSCLLAIVWFSLLPIAFTSSGVLAPVVTVIALILHQAAIWCFLFVPRLHLIYKGGSLKSASKLHQQVVRQASHNLLSARNSLTRADTVVTFAAVSLSASNGRGTCTMASPVAGVVKTRRSASLPATPLLREPLFLTSASIVSVTSATPGDLSRLQVKERDSLTASSDQRLDLTTRSCYKHLIESSL